MNNSNNETTGYEIAVIGMAGRFPLAKNIEEFWENIYNEKECISFFSKEEMQSEEIDTTTLENPNYVNAGGVLEDSDKFDAEFFNYSPQESIIMNPQHRIFMECAWEALENAAYTSSKYKSAIGVFAGSSTNLYLYQLLSNEEVLKNFSTFQLIISNSKDQLSTRVSHALNLTGPSLNIQTACSTSLVAVHTACQSLLSGDCTIALAGTVSIQTHQKTGYMYQEGLTLSKDGHCRAFDKLSSGTVCGNGVGVVVLKRYEAALADGDRIDAIIKGTAINNDGNLKVGYTAPSVQKQSDVISEAINIAGITADSISYIEAHGTGTLLGDPIEISALNNAFQQSTKQKNFCAIGSVKTNIGHLDVAAGISGLIKTILALKHKILPASLNFQSPNTNINFEDSPFYVNNKTKPWITKNLPRIAGVSSFGIGGTNAHIILQEAPLRVSDPDTNTCSLFCISAKSISALEKKEKKLLNFLEQNTNLNYRDISYTLQTCYHEFLYKKALIVYTKNELNNSRSIVHIQNKMDPNKVAKLSFLFPGQGSQYVNMARKLYLTEETYRNCIDNCANILNKYSGIDLLGLLYPKELNLISDGNLDNTVFAQPAIFIVEYALSQLYMSWGIKPDVMIGHSLGEYVAACIAEVFSLEDAIFLIYSRAKLMQQMPRGKMISIFSSLDDLKPILNSSISVAAINSDNSCVLSGEFNKIEDLEKRLQEHNILFQSLRTSHAFHSNMMEPILAEFKLILEKINISSPKIPFISNLTGTIIQSEEATNPEYWVNHLRNTVQFEKGIKNLANEASIFLEIGPGQTLNSLAKSCLKDLKSIIYLQSLPSFKQTTPAEMETFKTLGSLWVSGIKINFDKLYINENRIKVALPSYPFERKRHWLTSSTCKKNSQDKEFSNKFISLISPNLYKNDINKNHLSNDIFTSKKDKIEQEVLDIWKSVLGIDSININDEFYNKGGNSLLSVQLISKINQRFLVNISVVWVLENNTIEKQSLGLLDHITGLKTYQPIIKFKENLFKPMLFLIHPGHAGAEVYSDFAKLIQNEFSIYAIDSYNIYNDGPFINSIEKLAEKYVDYIKKIAPYGPYHLGGWSLGGTIAFEIAQRLTLLGDRVINIYMIDSFIYNNATKIYAQELDDLFFNLEEDKFFQTLPSEYREKALKVYKIELEMLREYRPQKYLGDVTLFNATIPVQLKVEMNMEENKFYESIKNSNGVLDYAPNLIEIKIKANHYSIMENQNLAIISETLLKNVSKNISKISR
ncbi:type I polyketide synthase [Silvanigrella aquatica]|uniref:Uncharacterized protein n=1 Tax=Silvanigrella aquatica TaxID=1915309 RepID=A0A1L4CYV6_9BACT|nr:type I polyketide synthase [Silvanigrella aquatica]APJ03117.1 hypothetical protein AXG55_04015 [Silvanigrella aquatica]